MAMRSSATRLSRCAGRAVSAAWRPLQGTPRSNYSTSSDTKPVNDKDYLLGTLPETMRAAVLWEPRKPMTIEELKMPRPQFGEVLIKTKGTPSNLHGRQASSLRIPSFLRFRVFPEILQIIVVDTRNHSPFGDPYVK